MAVADALKSDWGDIFNLNDKFDLVIGNPPYIKVQSMKDDYYKFLKSNFSTTINGGFNIFYAFIEKSMDELKENGELGFIVPNNFLKIKSGQSLRDYIVTNRYLKSIVDFDYNMVFSPVMTYNCILFLGKNRFDHFTYTVLPKTSNIEQTLNQADFKTMPTSSLTSEHWILHSDDIICKINKCRRFPIKIGKFIKTGIATLKDKLYIVESVRDNKFYMNIDSRLYEIESDIVKPFYKVSDIKDVNRIEQFRKYIIFPYKIVDSQVKPLQEDELKYTYPKTYNYFCDVRKELETRSSDNSTHWYVYGRSQGLNNLGEKLMFSQFLSYPKFIYNNDETSLFSNGFAIYQNDDIEIDILQKILQSSVLDFYIKHTSYSIDGGFYCYQKKYLKDFSIPKLNTTQKLFLRSLETQSEIDSYLEDIYFN